MGSDLPVLRRIVTSHDTQGKAIVQSNKELIPEILIPEQGITSAVMWTTNDSIPTADNQKEEDGALRPIVNPPFHLLPPKGTNLRTTDVPPGSITPMHRTSSLDYNILISGEVILIMEDGTETHLKNPGDTVIQKGTMHAWRNPSSQNWARWITVLMAAEPAVVNGEPLAPAVV